MSGYERLGILDMERSAPEWYSHMRGDIQMRMVTHYRTSYPDTMNRNVLTAYMDWIAQGGRPPEYYGYPEGKPTYIRGVPSPAMDSSGMVAWIVNRSRMSVKAVEIFLESLSYLHRAGYIPASVFNPATAAAREKIQQTVIDRKTMGDDLTSSSSYIIKAAKVAAVIVIGLAVLRVVSIVPPAPRRA